MLAWELELPSALASSWVEDGAAYHTGGDKFQVTRRVLAQHGLLGGTIGIERDSPYLSALEQDRLATALDGCALADGSGIVKQLPRVKSPQEIAYIRAAGGTTAAGMRAAIEAATAGATDNQVAAAAHQAMIAAGSEYPCGAPIVTTGPRSGIPHTTHRRIRIEPGDPVWIELAGCYQRYNAPLMRTVFVGQPPAGARQLADASLASLDAVLATVRPGLTFNEVAVAGARALPLDDASIVFHQTSGYSIGLGFPPSWADDETLVVQHGNQTVLEPGMVFHATMGLRRNGQYGAVTSETIAVTEAGCAVLTDFSRQYFYK
jgi:Xaa-Pro dipeptidase